MEDMGDDDDDNGMSSRDLSLGGPRGNPAVFGSMTSRGLSVGFRGNSSKFFSMATASDCMSELSGSSVVEDASSAGTLLIERSEDIFAVEWEH